MTPYKPTYPFGILHLRRLRCQYPGPRQGPGKTQGENGRGIPYLLSGEAGKLAIQARKTEKLRRRLLLTTQKARAYRALLYIGRQQVCGR